MATVSPPSTPLPWGTDGAVPIKNWDTDPMFRIWAKQQVYMGDEAMGRYIPKIGDYIEDTDFHITYQVIDLTTLWVPILKRITAKPIADMDSEDLLLGQTDDTYRVYIDKRSMPHRLQVDARCFVRARNAFAARIYRGNPITGTEEIVSMVLDQAGQCIGTLIPLQLSYTPNGQNVAQYYIPTAYTTNDIKDGEFLYAVLFDDTGAVLSSRGLRAVVTSFTASTDVSIKAVTGLALEGPLMSKAAPNKMEVPIGLTVNSMNLLGVINYNSGLPVRTSVDGRRFELLGMQSFVSSQAGQHFTMFLKLNLAAGEVSYTGGHVGPNRFIVQPIDVTVVDVENQLSPKLYPYPEWIGHTQGYRIRWWLLNLDRNIMLDVSSLVEIGTESPALDPMLYGVKQNITAVLNLNRVNSSWREWRHPQTVSITLMKPGDRPDGSTQWRIGFDPNQSPEYGDKAIAKSLIINQNLSELRLDIGFDTLQDWLEAYYYNTKPLTNPQLEDEAIRPTHFIIVDGDFSHPKVPIGDWYRTIQVRWPVQQAKTIYLKFVHQGNAQDLVLSVAGIPVEQVEDWNSVEEEKTPPPGGPGWDDCGCAVP